MTNLCVIFVWHENGILMKKQVLLLTHVYDIQQEEYHELAPFQKRVPRTYIKTGV